MRVQTLCRLVAVFLLCSCGSCGWEMLDVDISVLSNVESIVDSCVTES